MPLTLSAVKQARQNKVRKARLQPYHTKMKTLMRKFADALKDAKLDDAMKIVPSLYQSIDTAAKKGILHSNTADRKKSFVARALARASKASR